MPWGNIQFQPRQRRRLPRSFQCPEAVWARSRRPSRRFRPQVILWSAAALLPLCLPRAIAAMFVILSVPVLTGTLGISTQEPAQTNTPGAACKPPLLLASATLVLLHSYALILSAEMPV